MSGLFGAVFARGRAAEAVSDRAWLDAMLRVEGALAAAAAAAGAVDGDAAQAVSDAIDAGGFDLDAVGAAAVAIGNPVAGVVAELRSRVGEQHERAIHFAATSQDVLDTAMMLVAKDAVAAVAEDLHGCEKALERLQESATGHVIGRTLLQRARPLEAAERVFTWRSGLRQPANLLDALEFPGSYGGPVGAHWEMGAPEHFGDIRRGMSDALGLEMRANWHTDRSPVVRIGSAAAEAAGACAKVAVDVALLSQDEIGEVEEGRPGGSTSMPHKRNPVAATCARACAARTPGLLATLYTAMPQELQRSPGLWHSEWETLSDLLRLTGSAAAWLRESLEGLRIHQPAIERNLRDAEAAQRDSRSGEGEAR